MDDTFDALLAASLAPPERAPDRQFLLAVQARIALEERLAAERRAMIGGLTRQLAGLFALAAALWMFARADAVEVWATGAPAAAVLILVVAFGCAVALFLHADPPSVARA